MKSYFELTEDERNQRAKLTPVEQILVNEFIAAARALPKSIFIQMDDEACGPHLIVSKRITNGSGMEVASLRKKSLCFSTW